MRRRAYALLTIRLVHARASRSHCHGPPFPQGRDDAMRRRAYALRPFAWRMRRLIALPWPPFPQGRDDDETPCMRQVNGRGACMVSLSHRHGRGGKSGAGIGSDTESSSAPRRCCTMSRMAPFGHTLEDQRHMRDIVQQRRGADELFGVGPESAAPISWSAVTTMTRLHTRFDHSLGARCGVSIASSRPCGNRGPGSGSTPRAHWHRGAAADGVHIVASSAAVPMSLFGVGPQSRPPIPAGPWTMR